MVVEAPKPSDKMAVNIARVCVPIAVFSLVTKIEKRANGINVFIKSNLKLSNKDIGVSVACDGVCLTLITIKKK